ncbi:hypothetical protein VTK73DRAFT_8316 [Phialemonium thermophilum]|uniref:RNA-binding S4 domain-containing protein n=1 Tax=Phialemonium thermophilum TaxID=223376 RepID=A0ABR3Y657_9PEZI
MKFRRTLRFHGLKRPRIRQTWNKYNLYNLSRLGSKIRLRTQDRTFFQQKWQAKAMTRGYHGEHIKERHWERMFSRRLPSVVNMDPEYMAKFDGSEQATGRGSGRDQPAGLENRESEDRQGDGQAREGSRGSRQHRQLVGGSSRRFTPYMQMAFAPMERRLDIAIFRALFASSARQARQFVVHGAVKVNGKKMVYPGYLLNPGDLFQVDVERVLYATGRQKPKSLEAAKESADEAEEAGEEAGEEASKPDEAAESSPEATTKAVEANEETPEAAAEAGNEPVDEAATREKWAAELKALRARVKETLSGTSKFLNAKQKRELRRLAREAKTLLSRNNPSASQESTLKEDVSALISSLYISLPRDKASAAAEESSGTGADVGTQAPKGDDKQGRQDKDKNSMTAVLSPREKWRVRTFAKSVARNTVDPTKPYLTPWRPRPFMAPFAFIPRYLEVNPNICAAVYVRHPVVRQGMAEIPTPFSYDASQLAFNWYLRRG